MLSQRGIGEDIKTLLKNRNFVFNMCAFIIMWGTYVTLGNVLTPFFSPNGFTPTQISLIGVIFVFSGVVGCYIMGLFIDKTQKHLLGIRIITVSLAVLYVVA